MSFWIAVTTSAPSSTGFHKHLLSSGGQRFEACGITAACGKLLKYTRLRRQDIAVECLAHRVDGLHRQFGVVATDGELHPFSDQQELPIGTCWRDPAVGQQLPRELDFFLVGSGLVHTVDRPQLLEYGQLSLL